MVYALCSIVVDLSANQASSNMYRKILVALENGAADKSLLAHVRELALRLESQLLLVHVADGWVARNFEKLKLAESDEMKADRAYLEQVAKQLRAENLSVETLLALGDPPEEILKIAENGKYDLIAMGSHGHRFVGDLILGSTIHVVRHRTSIPVLLVRSAGKGQDL
jgi:nucleotide-binding universal stress UspA family protein